MPRTLRPNAVDPVSADVAPTEPAVTATSTHAHRTQLWFEQFRDLAFISLALAGGALTMLGTVFAAAPGRRVGFIALAWFVAGAIAALFGQSEVVAQADLGLPPGRRARRFRTAVYGCLGAGAGMFLSFAVLSLTR